MAATLASGYSFAKEPDLQEGDNRKAKRRKRNNLVLDHQHGVVIPADAFENQRPDDEEYEKGYLGNVSVRILCSMGSALTQPIAGKWKFDLL